MEQQKFSPSKLKYLYGLSPLYIDGAATEVLFK